ncbi:uncharacterized protein LOC142957723 [Anarhichas minor]|uniref:uncharacterized protein LOC142957723 n=1 Tax=Anarhichas minor TaxID=65739 RepID=UPI003F73E9C2
MNKVTLIFLAPFAAGLAQCFPVTASQGGNRSAQLFSCNSSGCADDVTGVYCNDVDLMTQTRIADCTGPPPPNTVCRHGGRAFVSIDTDGDCEFEGKSGYIVTEKRTDHSNIWAFISANTSSQVTTEDHARHRYIAGGVCGSALLIILIGTFGYMRSRWIAQSRERNQQPAARDRGVTIPLREMESPGETSDGDTPGSADGCSTSHCDRGA